MGNEHEKETLILHRGFHQTSAAAKTTGQSLAIIRISTSSPMQIIDSEIITVPVRRNAYEQKRVRRDGEQNLLHTYCPPSDRECRKNKTGQLCKLSRLRI